MCNWFSDNDGHIVLIRSDGSVVYEDGYDPTCYCDIYYCHECPKYRDDCDGKEENRVAYYERQGDEYVYYDENGCELYREDA